MFIEPDNTWGFWGGPWAGSLLVPLAPDLARLRWRRGGGRGCEGDGVGGGGVGGCGGDGDGGGVVAAAAAA